MNWQDHIVSDKHVLLGKPVIKNTRISVELLLELMEKGWSNETILQSYPTLNEDDLTAVFSFLKDCIQQEFLFPFKKTA